MGTKTPTSPSGVGAALFSPVQMRVLGLIFGQPERRFRSNEVIRLAGGGTGAVHRQLQRLAGAGLVTVTTEGNQKHYQASRESPVYSELVGLMRKTAGLIEPLRSALSSLAPRIAAAFVFGSIAKGHDRAQSDVDVIVISDEVEYPELYEAIGIAERALERRVNPKLFTTEEWGRKKARRDSFVARIASQPRLVLIGDPDAL